MNTMTTDSTRTLVTRLVLAATLAAPALALAQPAAQCALGGPASVVRGQTFTLDVDLSNTGTAAGYAPAVELFLPANVTFDSASAFGQAVAPLANTTTTPFV